MSESRIEVSADIHSSSVQESNLFLRKLWDELKKTAPLGWEFMPHRENGEKRIFVGICNLGEVYLHYEQRGIIDKISFFLSNDKDKTIVEDAIRAAKESHGLFYNYAISVEYDTDDIVFAEMAKYGIHICGKKREVSSNNLLVVSFNVKAFGDSDVRYVVTQKTNYLRMLLSSYTNLALDNPSITILRGEKEVPDLEWSGYDEDWIECFFESSSKEAAVLLPDFFALFRHVLDGDCFRNNMRFVLNASQDYFCAVLLKKWLLEGKIENIPGITDTINTMLISTLEPLSCIDRESFQTCPNCGKPKDSISEHIRLLCKTYLGDRLAKDIVKKGYRNRSSFLHEGNTLSNEYYCGEIVPQINPCSPRDLSCPVPVLEYNYFDFISYVFRKRTHDLLISQEQQGKNE